MEATSVETPVVPETLGASEEPKRTTEPTIPSVSIQDLFDAAFALYQAYGTRKIPKTAISRFLKTDKQGKPVSPESSTVSRYTSAGRQMKIFKNAGKGLLVATELLSKYAHARVTNNEEEARKCMETAFFNVQIWTELAHTLGFPDSRSVPPAELVVHHLVTDHGFTPAGARRPTKKYREAWKRLFDASAVIPAIETQNDDEDNGNGADNDDANGFDEEDEDVLDNGESVGHPENLSMSEALPKAGAGGAKKVVIHMGESVLIMIVPEGFTYKEVEAGKPNFEWLDRIIKVSMPFGPV